MHTLVVSVIPGHLRRADGLAAGLVDKMVSREGGIEVRPGAVQVSRKAKGQPQILA